METSEDLTKENLLAEKKGEINLLKLLHVLFYYRKFILFTVGVAFVIACLYCLFAAKEYNSSITLLPSKSNPSQDQLVGKFGGIAGILGIGFTGQDQNAKLYDDLLKSRQFCKKLIRLKFKVEGLESVMPILNLLGYDIDPQDTLFELKASKAIAGFFRKFLAVTILDNGIIKINLATPYGELSAKLLNTVVANFDEYHRENIFKAAEENVKFIEKRLEEINNSLKNSENSLKVFSEENRRIEKSPKLLLRRERLVREVKFNEELFITLKKEYELAKIQENRDASVIKVLDDAQPSGTPSWPKSKKILLLTLVCSFLLACVLAICFDYFLRFLPILITIFKK